MGPDPLRLLGLSFSYESRVDLPTREVIKKDVLVLHFQLQQLTVRVAGLEHVQRHLVLQIVDLQAMEVN